jgi:erythronate-4-phosphate dehydrogenase
MKIVADENIPFVKEVFDPLGDVSVHAGRAMTREIVKDAELLLVRSVTKVDADLLQGSRARFVATATIGFEHVDLKYLADHGIAFASAPGSNAESVAEYVGAALLVLESRGVLRLSGSTIGIVGVGNVGSRVDRVAKALGMKTLLCDPPRARAEGSSGFVTLDEVCARADVVTFHVPLERAGTDSTWHMIDASLLAKLKPGCMLFNSSRGGVGDSGALRDAKKTRKLGALVLDVFEGEPAIDLDVCRAADIVTPHIAGYSYDGKVAGTRMIYEAACKHLGIAPVWPDGIPPREDLRVNVTKPSILDAVRASYDIEADNARLREVLSNDSKEARAKGFDRLRKEYPRRREFRNWRVALGPGAQEIRPALTALGFVVDD